MKFKVAEEQKKKKKSDQIEIDKKRSKKTGIDTYSVAKTNRNRLVAFDLRRYMKRKV